MSFSTRQPTSGLGGLSRDWSDGSPRLQQQVNPTSSSQGSEKIHWPSSPKRPARPKADYGDRMARIQAALDAAKNTGQELLSASQSMKIVPQKRLSDENQPPVAVKRRVLPPSFREVNVNKEFGKTYSVSDVPTTSVPTPAPAPAPSSSFGSSSIMPRKYVPPPEESEKVPRIFLSGEQQHILKLVESGSNIFFTGSAGTGKSVLLREIIKSLRKKYKNSPEAVAITASTGIAACNIGGVTLHSFSGVGLGIEAADHLAMKIKRNKKASTRWLRTKVLIIDEISMVEGAFFDKLARVASIIRKNMRPFGGLQLVICGDFFQLPPVQKNSTVKFTFEADTWCECIERTFKLTKVFRQKDQGFVNMLNEVRYGNVSDESLRKFKALARPVMYDDGIEPTQLFPRREDVDRANEARLATLPGEMHTYTAVDGGTADSNAREKHLSNLMAPPILNLRLNAQVMLIKNVDETLVNGSIGIVVGFTDPSHEEAKDESKPQKPRSSVGRRAPSYPVVRFKTPAGYRESTLSPESWKVELPNGEVQASRHQLPLILAWAMSIHKSQGQTLERVKIDLNKVFEKGQAYVALSRATCLQGLEVYGFDRNKVKTDTKVTVWVDSLETLGNE